VRSQLDDVQNSVDEVHSTLSGDEMVDCEMNYEMVDCEMNYDDGR